MDSTKQTTILPFQRPTYTAKLTVLDVDGVGFRLAGTLDGYVDFAVSAPGVRNFTLSLSRDGARALVRGLNATLEDIERNCLFDRDALLEPAT